ncbi:hypothetical protein PM082_006899 [Marasmius tenuissimus]|nr:hypothetical protein PM082_006899 [Marasmius tenuissimus]
MEFSFFGQEQSKSKSSDRGASLTSALPKGHHFAIQMDHGTARERSWMQSHHVLCDPVIQGSEVWTSWTGMCSRCFQPHDFVVEQQGTTRSRSEVCYIINPDRESR